MRGSDYCPDNHSDLISSFIAPVFESLFKGCRLLFDGVLDRIKQVSGLVFGGDEDVFGKFTEAIFNPNAEIVGQIF
ncbi:hypothetical protein [Poriferisphaera sp. WC338]|uniref:hypothetical protein n=1 Tax=Poriferisphaera sp. WC338 TaxID=3425129 RepID=UPI003D8185D9